MLRTKFFTIFLLGLLVLPSFVHSKVHDILYNVLTVVDLQNGDEIRLANMPLGWGYSRVVLGVNSVPALPLSGKFVVNGCSHSLQNSYLEIDSPYQNDMAIVYQGPSQKLPLHWWVDASPVTSACEVVERLSRKDSVWQAVYSYADSVYEARIKKYVDLGTINTESLFEVNSGAFKISSLPDEFYNRLYVSIEPYDGRELNGFAYTGNKKLKIQGWSTGIALSQVTKHSPVFELVFPERRKIKLKWWATVETPKEDVVPVKEIVLDRDSVLVNYDFGRTPFTSATINLKFNRKMFVDGKIPSVKKLAFNPHGPVNLPELATMGDIYDIHANLNEGAAITFALPLDFEYVPGRDTLSVGHYIESEKKWVEEPVDSVVNNIAYFRATSFSLRSLLRKTCKVVNKVVTTVACPACAIYAQFDEDFANAMDNVVSKWATVQMALLDGTAADYVLDFIANLKCLNIDGIVDQAKSLWNGVSGLFSSDSKSSDWSVLQGTLSPKIAEDEVLISTLRDKRDKGFSIASKTLLDVCESISDALLVTTGQRPDCSAETLNAWKETSYNLEVLLADAILVEVLGDTRRYELIPEGSGEMNVKDTKSGTQFNFTEYFQTNGGMLEDAAEVVSGLRACYGATNITGKIVDKWLQVGREVKNGNFSDACSDFFTVFGFKDVFKQADDDFSCAEFMLLGVGDAFDLLDNHVDKLLTMSDVMTRVSLLAWIDKAYFRNFSASIYKSVYDGSMAWLELAAPVMTYNNVVIKAFASLALFEYINYGTSENFDMMNAGMGIHYGDNGGFSEGTGYSQYIWDDVTYILASLKEAYMKNETKNLVINNNFLKSPDYMIEFSRPVMDYGMIPVEVDDGVTYNPDYRVWAKLKDDPKYLAWGSAYPLKARDGKINALVPFGFPDANMYKRYEKEKPGMPAHKNSNLWGSFKDGLAMITAVDKNKDTIALSMVAESGNMLKNGQSHDQQDNLSFTLTSSKKGFIFQDRGYSGFSSRGSDDVFHKYSDHNVLVLGKKCPLSSTLGINYCNSQPDNQMIDASGIMDRLAGFSGQTAGLTWTVNSYLISALGIGKKYFMVEGGFDAEMQGMINDPEAGVIGFSAKTSLTNTTITQTAFAYNTRTILYFGGTLWVIDQPSDQGMAWLANSPIDEWNKFDVRANLYGSSQERIADVSAEVRFVTQNGSRTDFEGQTLKNYQYVVRDDEAYSFVMNFAVDGDGFYKNTTDKCPSKFQCFVNRKGDKRLIIPYWGKKYSVATVLGQKFRGKTETDGILMAEKASDGVWDYRIINGKTYGDDHVCYLAGPMKILLMSR